MNRAIILLTVAIGTLWVITDAHVASLILEDMLPGSRRMGHFYAVAGVQVTVRVMLVFEMVHCLAATLAVVGAVIATTSPRAARLPFIIGMSYMSLWSVVQLSVFHHAGNTLNSIVASKYIVQAGGLLALTVISVITLTRHAMTEHADP